MKGTGTGAGTVRACVGRGGTLRVIHTGKHCPAHHKQLTWARQGVAGVPGPPGTPGAPGAAGPSHIYSTSTTQVKLASSPEEATVAVLNLPGGSYEVSAKLYIEVMPTGISSYAWRAGCRLKVGGAEDFSLTEGATPAGGYGADEPMSLMVVHSLATGGAATLSCFKESTEATVEAKSVVLTSTLVGAIN